MSKAWHPMGKAVLITGGSSGIGLALARLLAREGASLCLLARDRTRLEAALEEVRAASLSRKKAGSEKGGGGRAIPAGVQPEQRFGIVSADVASEQQVEAALEEVSEMIGLPDLVVNSAGITQPGYVQELSLDIFRAMMAVNYLGTVYVTKAVLPGMLKRGSGYLVNISSMAGLIGVFGYSAYGAAKFAVRGFTDVLRAELKGLGIDVSIVFPPDTDTPQLAYETPFKPPETRAISSLNKVLSAEAVAQAILDGIRRRRYIILPGFDSKLTFWLGSLSGTLVYPVMDWLIARARHKMKSGSL